MTENLTPGDVVHNPAAPEWGPGRVQSVVGRRVTVNFEERGKVVVDTAHVRLAAGPPEDQPKSKPG